MPENTKTIHNPTQLLEKISAEFPDLQWSNYRYVDEGWDHEVIILDERVVFRFPNDKEYLDALKEEIDVLELLFPKVNIAVPHYTYIARDYAFAGYDIISGKQLLKELFDSFEPDEYAAVVKQLAGFLSTIHTLPIDKGILSTISPSYLLDDQAVVRSHMEKRLKPLLSVEDYTIAEKIMSDIDDLLQQQLPTVFTHNDVYSRHLLWDNEAKRLGLIDFSDMCLGDPAMDFAELYEFGSQFVRDLYDSYTGPKDDTFLERAWKYQQWIGVYMMTDYFEIHKTSFEVARETFDRIKNGPPV